LQKISIKVDMDMYYKLFETQNSLTCTTNAKILATQIGESWTHH